MAEFLQILSDQYDYPQLAEEILRELSGKEFNSNDLRGPKSVSSFISKLSELAPRLVIKQMTMLAKFLDTDVSLYTQSFDSHTDKNSLIHSVVQSLMCAET